MTSILNSIAVDTGSVASGQLAVSRAVASIKVDVFDIEGVNVTGDVAEKGQADVDT
jgi:hypothetical protein